MPESRIEFIVEAVVGVVALVLLVWLVRKRMDKKRRDS
jgi:membrane associated rhomboid family serine protease